MTGPLATSHVEVTADTSAFDEQLVRKLRAATNKAGPEVRRELRRIFTTAGTEAAAGMSSQFNHPFGTLNAKASASAQHIVAAFREAAITANHHLGGIGFGGGPGGLTHSFTNVFNNITNMGNSATAASGKAGGALGTLGSVASGIASKISSVMGAAFDAIVDAAQVAAVASAAALSFIAKEGIEASAHLEQTRIAFTGLLGSASEANDLVAQMQKFAAATPFEFQGLADSTQALLGMGKAAGISKDQVLPVLSVLGDMAANAGKGQEAIDRVVLALGQMSGAGKITTGDLRQISDALPGFQPLAAIGKELGLTTAQLNKMTTDGTLPAQAGIAALIKGMSEWQGAAGAMQRQSESLAGMWSTFTDDARAALIEGFEPAIPEIKTSLAELTPVVAAAAAELAPALGGFLAKGMSAIGPLLTGWAHTVTPILDSLSAGLVILQPAIEPIAGALASMATALTPLIPMAAQLATLIAVPLAGALQGFFELVGPSVSAVAGPLTSALQELMPLGRGLADMFVKLGTEFGPVIAQTFAPLAKGAVTVARAFADELLPHLPDVIAAFERFLPLAEQIAGILADQLSGNLTGLAQQAPQLADAFLSLAFSLSDMLVALTPVIVAFTELFGGAMMSQGNAAAEALTLGLGSLTDTFRMITDAAHMFLPTARAVVKALLVLGDQVEVFWDRIRDKAPAWLKKLIPEDTPNLAFKMGREAAEHFISGANASLLNLKVAGPLTAQALGIKIAGPVTVPQQKKGSLPAIPKLALDDKKAREERERAAKALREQLKRIAEYLADGFIEGLTGRTDGIRDASKRMLEMLTDDAIIAKLGASRVNALVSGIRRDTVVLVALGKQRDGLADQLADAQAHLEQLVTARGALFTKIGDQVRESFDLVPERGSKSVDRLLRDMGKAVTTAAAFTRDFAALKARGLHQVLLDQLIAAGPIAGARQAAKLAAATGPQLAALNKMGAQLDAAANTAGNTVADSMYAAGIAASKGLVAGLTSQQKQVEAAMLKIALAMQAAIKKALGIRSPSTVAAGIGAYWMDGLRGGLLSGLGALADTMRRIGAVTGTGLASPTNLRSLPLPGTPGGNSRGSTGTSGGSRQLFRDLILQVPTADPEAAAQAVVNRLAAKVA